MASTNIESLREYPDSCVPINAPATDQLALQQLVRSLYRSSPLRVIEVGSWIGATALALADSVPEEVEVHCVDTWEGSVNDITGPMVRGIGRERLLRLFCKNVNFRLFCSVFPHVGTSEFWASVWPWQADLIFLDADHKYESVLQDIRVWTPHVRLGGILCGHDLGEGFPGVEQAVSETGPFERAGESIWFRQL